MRNLITAIVCGCFLTAPSLSATAQPGSAGRTPTVVLFLPLHLDSIFDAQGTYTFKRYEFPRFVSGPLEFYQGFAEALDSLKKHPGQLDLLVVDTRSERMPLGTQLLKDSIQRARIWLMHGNAADSRTLAEAARKLEKPLININLPNDGGIESNPYYFLWNNTLETQCDAIYRYLQQYYPLEEIVLVRRKGNMEDRILGIWKEKERSTKGVPLKYTVLEVADSMSAPELMSRLDSNKQTILFGASLDEKFARNLASASADVVKAGYTVELLGMSTWDNAREFSSNRFRNLEITIPTPFFYPRTDEWSKRLQTSFLENKYSRPSDGYLRGYEMAWFLYPLTLRPELDWNDVLPGKKNLLFAEVNWQPVLSPLTTELNYFENKKLYFVKRYEGNVRLVR